MSVMRQVRCIFHCDSEGRIVQAEPGCRTLLGVRDGCDLLPLLVDAASAAKCERFLQQVRVAGGAFGWELDLRLERGVSTALFAGLRQQDGRFLVAFADTQTALLAVLDAAVAHDFCLPSAGQALPNVARLAEPPALDALTRVNNDLVSLQRDLAKRNAELTAITRQRNQLLATAAHDLRNPILVVQGYCDLLGIASSAEGSPQREFVDQVKQASELMLRVIEETLEFAQLEAGEVRPRPAPVDLLELVQKSAQSYGPSAARKDIALVVTRTEVVPLLWLDATNIERVIGNLLSNAIKFSHRGGRVELALGLFGANVVLTVSDVGPGIAEAEVPLLFRPFQTTSTRPTAGEPSTGLGLAIVRDLVEANGGTVSVHSSLHHGATFEVSFPRAPLGAVGCTQIGNELGREPAINVRRGRNHEKH